MEIKTKKENFKIKMKICNNNFIIKQNYIFIFINTFEVAMIKVIPRTNAISNISQTAKETLPKITKSVLKKASAIDVLLFRQYLFSKNFELQTAQEEIQSLFKLEGEEFFNASFEFLFKKLGVPECLKPGIVEAPLNEKIGMAYDYSQNYLIKNPNAPEATKLETYFYIRHELQHMIQNFEMYRHKGLGEKIISFYVEKLAESQVQFIDNYAKNVSIEQMENLGYPPEAISYYKNLKFLLENNNEEEYLKVLEQGKAELIEDNTRNLQNFRSLIINEMGFLKEGSRAERRAEKFYNDTVNNNYSNADGEIHSGKYSYDIRENEAFIAQEVAMLEALRHLSGENKCFIAYAKQRGEKDIEKLKNSETMTEEFKETIENFKTTSSIFDSPKALADYLFD